VSLSLPASQLREIRKEAQTMHKSEKHFHGGRRGFITENKKTIFYDCCYSPKMEQVALNKLHEKFFTREYKP